MPFGGSVFGGYAAFTGFVLPPLASIPLYIAPKPPIKKK